MYLFLNILNPNSFKHIWYVMFIREPKSNNDYLTKTGLTIIIIIIIVIYFSLIFSSTQN